MRAPKESESGDSVKRSTSKGGRGVSGKLWVYSDQLDGENLEFAWYSFFRYSEKIAYYCLTEKTVMRLAREANAIYKIDGKMVLIKKDFSKSSLS